jgi:hypothetical protein
LSHDSWFAVSARSRCGIGSCTLRSLRCWRCWSRCLGHRSNALARNFNATKRWVVERDGHVSFGNDGAAQRVAADKRDDIQLFQRAACSRCICAGNSANF